MSDLPVLGFDEQNSLIHVFCTFILDLLLTVLKKNRVIEPG